MNQWQGDGEDEYVEEYYPDDTPIERTPLPFDLQMPFWLKISVLSFVLVLLLIALWWSSMNPFANSRVVPLESPSARDAASDRGSFSQTPSQVVPVIGVPSRYYSNSLNLSFMVPAGWREVTIPSEELPPGVNDVSFMFYNEEANCVIAAADFERRAADYAQTSFGGRVFSQVSQFDGDWFTNQAYHQEKITFSDTTRQFLSHELRHTYNLDVADLLLFERAGRSVPQRCDADFVAFLQSTEHHYLKKQLESYEGGEITTRRVSYRDGQDEIKLLFTSDIDGNTYELTTLPGFGFVNRIFARDSTLYFVGRSENQRDRDQTPTTLYSYNFETDRLQSLQRYLGDDNEYITSLYVTEDSLYYISGSDSSLRCFYGPGYDCEQQLFRLTLDSSEAPELLASSTPATDIMGYVDEQKTLYMRSGYGDAGCITMRIYVHAAEGTHEAARFGGCDGDQGYEEYAREMTRLQSSLDETSAKAARKAYRSLTVSDFVPAWYSATFILVSQ